MVQGHIFFVEEITDGERKKHPLLEKFFLSGNVGQEISLQFGGIVTVGILPSDIGLPERQGDLRGVDKDQPCISRALGNSIYLSARAVKDLAIIVVIPHREREMAPQDLVENKPTVPELCLLLDLQVAQFFIPE